MTDANAASVETRASAGDESKAARPVRRVLRRWPSWAGYAAAAWSLGYGLLGLLWTLGVPGFPFGEGDIPDARDESILGTATAAGTRPWIAALGLVGAIIGLVLARSRLHGPLRFILLTWGWLTALALALIPDQRVLTAVAYTPVSLVGIPFGWPPLTYAEFFQKLYPWQSINLIILIAGAALWAAATVAFQRRSSRACLNCGRRAAHPSHWTTPRAAARWGRWAAYTAFVLPFTYAAIRWPWAFGIPLTISDEFLDELHRTGMVWAGAYLATFAAVGGVLTLGLVQRWGVIWPRWVLGLAGKRVPPAFPITFASIVAVSLLSAGMVMIRLADWSEPQELVSNPLTLWPLWALALGAATLAYYFRTRGTCRVCNKGWVTTSHLGRGGRDEAGTGLVVG